MDPCSSNLYCSRVNRSTSQLLHLLLALLGTPFPHNRQTQALLKMPFQRYFPLLLSVIYFFSITFMTIQYAICFIDFFSLCIYHHHCTISIRKDLKKKKKGVGVSPYFVYHYKPKTQKSAGTKVLAIYIFELMHVSIIT